MALLTAKTVAIICGLATIAFCVSTIVLAVQKNDLENELQDALDKLDSISTTAPPPNQTTPSNPPPSSTPDPGTTSPGPATPSYPTPDTSTPSVSSDPSTPSVSPDPSTPSVSPDPSTPSVSPAPSTPSVSPDPSTPSVSPAPSTPSVTPDPSTPSNTPSTTTPFPWPNVTEPSDKPNFPTLPPGMPNPEEFVYRLPTDIWPVKYRLYFHPDWEKKTCVGQVSVQIEVDVETNLIIMHAKDLVIDGISILNMMGRMRIRVRKFYLDAKREFLVIELEEVLRLATPYVVSIDYECSLDGLSGIYTSSYTGEDGADRWIATSKFEPTYARQAFPCFDEPAMKAEFTITVVRPSGDGYHALSNMDMKTEKDIGNNLTEVTFAESVKMSTYLACFIVSDFDSQKAIVQGTLPGAEDFEMRVFATAEQINKVDYALTTGQAITEFYIGYFNVAYPLPKLDMAAIPDFASGAMEHWGLVTFRETALLYDADSSSSANQQRVATVVAHELAHMWFGNLVTMKWWNDLWLNEGFASYIEYKGVNHVHEDWGMLDQFLIEDMYGVMTLDATLASHPIVQPVESPNQITELFDSITYSKGASIIRMLEDTVGPEKFRSATTNYLQKHIFNNAETDDFLTEIEAQEFEYDVKLLMKTWTEQMGLPVVEVAQSGNRYTLTQKRFLSNPEDYNVTVEQSQFNYRWTIPITYFTSSDPTLVERTMFNHNDNEVSIGTNGPVDWIKFNKNQVGYYHVNYPADMWSSLTTVLVEKRGNFSNADRAHLINDAFVLAGAAQLPYKTALDLSKYLEKELDYVPWSVGTSRLNAVQNSLYYTELYGEFGAYVRTLLAPAYQAVTWEVGATHLLNRLRVTILDAACKYGHEDALQEAGKRFTAWLQNTSERPPADLRSTIYYYGMQVAGTEKIWNQVWQLFVAESDAQEKIKLMEALSAIKEPWILQKFINLAWEEQNVRGQDYFSCLINISRNRIGQPLVWDYVRENWERLVARFTINDRSLGRLIPSITSRFATQLKLEEMETFFAKYPDAGAGTAARKQALETVKYNINWLKQNKQQVGDWLAALNGESTETSILKK